MVKKNADGSIEVSFELSKAQVQYLSESPLGLLRLDCGGEVLLPSVDSKGALWLAFSWDSVIKRELFNCGGGLILGLPESQVKIDQGMEEQRSPEPKMETTVQPKESVVMCFRNGCVAAYVEQDDGTYKVVISNGEMHPRHLRLINQVVELFKECSKEDRPAKVREDQPVKDKPIYCDVGNCHHIAVLGSTKCKYHGGTSGREVRSKVKYPA